MENVWRDLGTQSLANDRLRIAVEPAHGMTIRSIEVPGYGGNILWARPGTTARARTRRLGATGSRSIDTLHELLIGGWFELSPHAGLPGRVNGRATMLHGEACRLPWRVEAVDRSGIAASARCVRYPLLMERRIAIDGSTVTARSVLRNDSERTWTVSHGEHPCFDRAVFAGGVISADVGAARVLDPFDRSVASLRPGAFDWPWAVGLQGGRLDVSRIPERPTANQDHIAVRLASPTVQLATPSGLVVRMDVDLDRHPYLLLWRNFGAPGSSGHDPWDVFAVEPQSTFGFGVVDATRSDLTALQPGQSLTTQVSLTVTVAGKEVP